MTDSQSEKLRAFLKERKNANKTKSNEEHPKVSNENKELEPLDIAHETHVVQSNDEPVHAPVHEADKIASPVVPVSEETLLEPVKPVMVQMPPVDQTLERDAKLKAFLHHRRTEAAHADEDLDDPFEGDAIAKKNLRYLTKYLEREDIADIKEIVINKPEEVGLEYSDGHWEWVADSDLTQDQLEEIARTLANKSGQLFHAGNPILSVKMPGGHRVQIVAGFNAPSGFVFSMRLQRKEKFGLKDFTMPEEERLKVQELVRNQKTILISGGTGTGKTSYMNALIPSIPEDERLVSMEDVPELNIPHKNWVRLLFSGSDTAMGDQGVLELLNACLRLRPDRIILGEIRKENAFAFCSAINTGHEGSMATIHANSPAMALDAVINRVMMNGDLPDSAMEVLRRQLKHDIYAVVQLTKIHKGVKAELCVLQGDDKE